MSDHSVRIWDVATGEELRRFDIPTMPSAVAFSQDSKQIVIGEHLVAKLRDIDSGNLLVSYPNQPGFVNSVVFTPDGRNVVLCAAEAVDSPLAEKAGAVRIYPIDSADEGRVLAVSPRGCWGGLSISPDGEKLAIGFSTPVSQLTVLDLSTSEKISQWGFHGSQVVYLPEGRLLTLGQLNNGYRVKLWEANTGRFIRGYPLRTPLQRKLTVTPDFRHAITSDNSSKIYVWNIETGEDVAITETPDITTGLDVSPDGKYLLSCGGVQVDQGSYVTGTDFDLHLWQLPESVWPENPPDDDAPRSNSSESNVPLDGDKELTPTKPPGKTNDNPQ